MEILNMWNQYPEGFMRRIVTGGDTWLYQYNAQDKGQSKQRLPIKWKGQSKSKLTMRKGYGDTFLGY